MKNNYGFLIKNFTKLVIFLLFYTSSILFSQEKVETVKASFKFDNLNFQKALYGFNLYCLDRINGHTIFQKNNNKTFSRALKLFETARDQKEALYPFQLQHILNILQNLEDEPDKQNAIIALLKNFLMQKYQLPLPKVPEQFFIKLKEYLKLHFPGKVSDNMLESLAKKIKRTHNKIKATCKSLILSKGDIAAKDIITEMNFLEFQGLCLGQLFARLTKGEKKDFPTESDKKEESKKEKRIRIPDRFLIFSKIMGSWNEQKTQFLTRKAGSSRPFYELFPEDYNNFQNLFKNQYYFNPALKTIFSNMILSLIVNNELILARRYAELFQKYIKQVNICLSEKALKDELQKARFLYDLSNFLVAVEEGNTTNLEKVASTPIPDAWKAHFPDLEILVRKLLPPENASFSFSKIKREIIPLFAAKNDLEKFFSTNFMRIYESIDLIQNGKYGEAVHKIEAMEKNLRTFASSRHFKQIIFVIKNEALMASKNISTLLENSRRFLDYWNRRIRSARDFIFFVYKQFVISLTGQKKVSKFHLPYVYEYLKLLNIIFNRLYPLLDYEQQNYIYAKYRPFFNSLFSYNNRHGIQNFYKQIFPIKAVRLLDNLPAKIPVKNDLREILKQFQTLLWMQAENSLVKRINSQFNSGYEAWLNNKFKDILRRKNLLSGTKGLKESYFDFSLQLTQKALDDETVIIDLYKYVDEKSIFSKIDNSNNKYCIFIISKKAIQSIALNLNRDTLKELEDIKKIFTVQYSRDIKEDIFFNNMKRIHKNFVTPLLDYLGGKRNIIFIPDGVFWKFPFEALPLDLEEKTFLIEKYSVNYINSILELFTSADKVQARGDGIVISRQQDKTDRPEHIFFGDAISLQQFKEIHSRRLIFEEPILEALKIIMPVDIFNKLEIRLAEKAQLSQFLENAGLFKYIHFFNPVSLPGTLESKKNFHLKLIPYYPFKLKIVTPLFDLQKERLFFQQARLNFFPLEQKEKQLDWQSFADLNFSSKKLLFFSTTNSPLAAKEMESVYPVLSRAIAKTMPQNYIMSMWKVPEENRKEFILYFYTNLFTKGQSVKNALRNAKLYLLQRDRDAGYANFHYWSGWPLFGRNWK
ncbi:CHAT domain-containing protein [Candidatus Riflebacteria bacterium]